MTKIMKYFVMFCAVGTTFSNAYAIEESKVPKEKRSTTGLYFTSKEASVHMTTNSISTLFVDVRDPAEIFTVGMPESANTNVPFKRINLNKWDKKKSTFKLPENPDFAKDVAARLTAMHPMGRVGRPEEVASTVLWLCSEDASFVEE